MCTFVGKLPEIKLSSQKICASVYLTDLAKLSITDSYILTHSNNVSDRPFPQHLGRYFHVHKTPK